MLPIRVYLLVLWFLIRVTKAEGKPLDLHFQQSDYELKFEWGKVNSYNKDYLSEFHGIVFKYNRTCTAANLTTLYTVDIGHELELIVQAYRFSSNEFRVFPLRAQVNFCVAVQSNTIGSQRAYSCGHFKGCPIKKGVRNVICNFVPDASRFPPFVPSGRYKLEVQGIYRDIEMFVVEAYGEIYRPFVERKRKH